MRDEVIEKILKKIQYEIKRDYGLELSLDEIESIVSSQFKSVVKNMAEFKQIKLTYFGKFMIKEGKIDAINSHKELNSRDLTEEEKDTIMKARGKAANIERKNFTNIKLVRNNEAI